MPYPALYHIYCIAYTIEALEILYFLETTDVLLEDKLEDVTINLTEESFYSFFANANDNPDRFLLHFMVTPDNTLEISDNSGIQIFASGSIVYLKKQDNSLLNGEIQVIDLTGRLISMEKVDGIRQHQMSLKNNGIFIVMFYNSTNQKEYRQKVHLK